MNTNEISLARRARAAVTWRWLTGMRWLLLEEDGRVILAGRVEDGGLTPAPAVPELAIPDVADWATKWCLLKLVRDRWADPSAALAAVDESTPTRWSWTEDGLAAPMLDMPGYYDEYDSELDALVVALEQTPTEDERVALVKSHWELD